MPDYVYTMLPLEKMKTTTFSITPVFFNVGINEKATIAHKMGYNGPQEKNNVDNFKMLAEYCRRYRKLNLDTAGSQRNKREYSITPHSVEIIEFHSRFLTKISWKQRFNKELKLHGGGEFL